MMNETRPWHEDDKFWQTFAPMMFGQKCWEVVPTEIDQVVALLGIEPGTRILDLCCGPGRHSLELARRGFRVTGVDRTAAYLEKARKQAKSETLTIEFVQDDMRRFCRPDSFDGVINMFTSFGYFEDPADDRQVPVNIHQSLKTGGTLVMDIMGKEVLARIFSQRTWEEKEGVIVLQEHKVCKNWSWTENRWIMLKGQHCDEVTISHRLYSAAELSDLLADCGFDSVDIYGDLAGTPYDHQAKRLVAVARK